MFPETFATMETSASLTGALLVVLALAVRSDLLRNRVPNSLNLAGLILGVGLSALAAGPIGVGYSVAGTVVGCAALMPFYFLRGMGAGDVKLMGAAGAFLGPIDALLAGALALVVGALVAVVIICWRLVEPRVQLLEDSSGAAALGSRRIATTISTVRKERFPYAIAIAVGVLAVLWWRGSLGSLLGASGLG